MTPSDLPLPSKACHNCRRKRWKCDRSFPVCQKCISTGQECLGYKKLFVWADGVASRGKMVGKSFEESSSATPKKQSQKHAPSLPAPAPAPAQPNLADGWQSYPSRPAQCNQLIRGGLTDLPSSEVVRYEDSNHTQIQWPLVDPLIQDLNEYTRYYLLHFATKICADIVAYDGPGQNPMRDLVSATSSYPLLLQIMVANSAFHIFNISQNPVDFSSPQQRDNSTPGAVMLYSGPNRKHYRDALIAKQEALSLLAKSVTVVDATNIDLVLAAILLFVNYDLIESGTDKWKVHMEGAHRLISLLGCPSYQPHTMSKLRTSLLSDFLVFYILGSTFRFSSSPKLFPDPIDVEPILQYAETNNYLCCPAPLLCIMLKSFTLSDFEDTSEVLTLDHQESLKALLELALSFDPANWVSNFRPASPFEDLTKRLHLASAHRSAVCVYLARFIPITNPLLDPSGGSAVVSLTGLADDIVHHISHLQPGDSLFKSISWPLFLAGTESEDPAQRAWIMDTLDCFYGEMHWGYIRTVQKVLKDVWAYKEAGATCWVTEVKKMGTEIMIA